MTHRDLDCVEVIEIVTDYLEGLLSEFDRDSLDYHLTICGGCAAYLEQMQAAIRLSGTLRREDLPAPLMDALLHSFRGEHGH
ncbi:MAG: zf-HC2 domain-containing protein [Acidimicrobiales bacterium]